MADNIKKRKILIFSTAYYPFIAGAEVSIKEITDRLSGDFQFDLITAKLQRGLPAKEKIGSVTVYRVGFGYKTLDKLLLPFRGALLAWKLNKSQKYSCMWAVMVTFSSGAGYILNILRVITGKKKIPIILALQEGDSEDYLKYKWFGLIDLSWRLALWNTDIVTGLSNFLLDRAKRKGFNGEMVLVPNGVDVDLFTKTINLTKIEELKNKLGKKSDSVFLVTSSRLTHKNATDDIISALTHLPTNISLIIIGKGDLGPDLQKQARDLEISDRVKFVGFILHTELPLYLSVCDIFIRPSRSEGFGNSFIEAMAAGLPVVATPVGGIVDFIDDKETGVFCSTDNPQSIVQAVTSILTDNSLKSRITVQAKSRVLERYNWDFIAVNMKDIFQSLS